MFLSFSVSFISLLTQFVIASGVAIPPALRSLTNPLRPGHQKGCAKLTNQGTFFTLRVSVGTPPQFFDAVADTGSTTVIIPSCACQELGECASVRHNCFRGTNHSSTFDVSYDSDGRPSLYEVVFGSGNVWSVISTDVVRLAGVEHTMENGLLLLLKEELNMQNVLFEGIFGLGRPIPEAPGFMKDAGLSHFTMCFDDAYGFLNIEGPEPLSTLSTISDEYWAVGLQKVTIGEFQLQICSESENGRTNSTPCAAIPDSGTTFIMAPQKHITSLQEALCDEWMRCKILHDTIPPAFMEVLTANNGSSKGQIFESLVAGCEDLEGMPSIEFHVVGNESEEEILTLPFYNYVVKTDNFCTMALTNMEVDTENNGPVWIFGMPLFFEYHVSYKLEPPSMSFMHITSENPCISCGGGVSLVQKSLQQTQQRLPREVSGPRRVMHVDGNKF